MALDQTMATDPYAIELKQLLRLHPHHLQPLDLTNQLPVMLLQEVEHLELSQVQVEPQELLESLYLATQKNVVKPFSFPTEFLEKDSIN